MAFIHDELSLGYHPDFCSPCCANDCHGACMCEVEIPEPGLLCDMCGGTGCPKCGCVPAPIQTYLSHQRVSFPKCTCDAFPKKCMKCCRKRLPCDCLPPDESVEEMDTIPASGESCNPCPEDGCGPFPPTRTFLLPECDPCGYPAKRGNVNNANSMHVSFKSEPMDVEQCKLARRRSRRKGRSRSRGGRKKSRSRSARSAGKKSRYNSRRGGCGNNVDLGCKETCDEKYEGELHCKKTDGCGEKCLTDYKAGAGEYKYDMCDPDRQLCVAKVTQKRGPCEPPVFPMSTAHDDGACCKSDCEKPIIPPQQMEPCDPRPACICKKDCKKEFCMIMHGRCLRCNPRPLANEKCRPCDAPKCEIKLKPKKKRHPCDYMEDCEDPCEVLFGRCETPQPCLKPCNTGECENACLIM